MEAKISLQYRYSLSWRIWASREAKCTYSPYSRKTSPSPRAEVDWGRMPLAWHSYLWLSRTQHIYIYLLTSSNKLQRVRKLVLRSALEKSKLRPQFEYTPRPNTHSHLIKT